ncbi:MAG: prepilin peptidase [Coriobacteriia bacterium]
MGTTAWYVAAFVLGLAFGSFANVVVWRFPRGQSLSTPGSHCPSCEHPIRWRDNIPVFSWLILRARCRDCGAPIHWRYPAIELLTALLWVLAVREFGASARAAMAAVAFYLLLVLAFIDLDLRRLPNPIVAILALIGVVGVIVTQATGIELAPLTHTTRSSMSPVLAAAIGSASAAGVSLGIALLYSATRGRQGLGMGDVKLLGALGPFLGVYTIGALVLGSFLGTVWGGIAASGSGEGGRTRFAFGPCLAASGIVIAVVGPEIWHWYAGLVGLTS